jgi:hypothetical protein
VIYINFLKFFCVGATAVFGVALFINYLFDPLWYFGGNKVQSHNYAFDERLSKLNILKKGNYNCLILGSSRVTFLKPSQLTNAKCFNMSFSGGTVDEFIDFAKLIKKHFDIKVDYLIVGVDGVNFFNLSKSQQWTKAELPPNFLVSYLSIDALLFSKRLLLEQTSLPRIYNQQFEVEVIPKLPVFTPEKGVVGLKDGQFDQTVIEKYIELRDIFKPKKTIYYVPPLSAWHIEDIYNNKLLDNYLSAIYSFQLNALDIVDYSAISTVTLTPLNTYDGHHFLPKVSSLIAEDLNKMLNNEAPLNDGFGIYVNKLSYKQYNDDYKSQLKKYFKL